MESECPRSPEFILFIRLFMPGGQCQGTPGPSVPGLNLTSGPRGLTSLPTSGILSPTITVRLGEQT